VVVVPRYNTPWVVLAVALPETDTSNLIIKEVGEELKPTLLTKLPIPPPALVKSSLFDKALIVVNAVDEI
jgi:hypothetical protein